MANSFIFVVFGVGVAIANAASKEPTVATLEKWARLMERQVPAFPTQLVSWVGELGYCSHEAIYDDNSQAPKFVNLLCPTYALRCERIRHQSPFAYREKFCYVSSKQVFQPETCDSLAGIDTSVRILPEPFSLKEFDVRWHRDDDIGKYRRNYLQCRQGEFFRNYFYDTLSGLLASVDYYIAKDSMVQRDRYVRFQNEARKDTLVLKQESRYWGNKWEMNTDSYRRIRYDSLGRIRWQRKAVGNFPDPNLDDLYGSVPDVEYFYDSKGRNHLRVHRYPLSQRLIALTSLRYDSLGRLDRQTVGYITKDSLIGWVFHHKWTYDSLGREKRVQEYENMSRIDAMKKSHYHLRYGAHWWRW